MLITMHFCSLRTKSEILSFISTLSQAPGVSVACDCIHSALRAVDPTTWPWGTWMGSKCFAVKATAMFVNCSRRIITKNGDIHCRHHTEKGQTCYTKPPSISCVAFKTNEKVTSGKRVQWQIVIESNVSPKWQMHNYWLKVLCEKQGHSNVTILLNWTIIAKSTMPHKPPASISKKEVMIMMIRNGIDVISQW